MLRQTQQENELSYPMRIHGAIKNSAFSFALVPLYPLRSGNRLIPPVRPDRPHFH
ncbi:hypothetical protein K457DRAFT_132444 [Linnemannia elongata AG-77]|uniref:Uncharacterized protein n=1 Tax=Linnemannia elongata AG-77 TaxID=1314771 RepID=A0A197KGE8_9FUNG|nr:hypothetical protein K457DRAFT_132444 [Linnemannia elongata AG-77]